jgi:transcription initiation factor TFIID subunit 5
MENPRPIAGLADLDQNDLSSILKIFQKYNLKESEEIFKRELNKKVHDASSASADPSQKERDFYFEIYDSLHKFIESTKDHKYELGQILYPMFLHFYLDMINKDFTKLALEFFDEYSGLQSSHHAIDLKQLKLITNKWQLSKSELKETYSYKYNVKLSEESYRHLKDFAKMKNSKQFIELMKENIMLELYNGPLREFRQQSIHDGGILGETNSNNNTNKIYYGLLKEELNLVQEENDDPNGDAKDEGEKPKRRKNRRDALLNKKNRPDPNAPQINRVPLPETRDIDRSNKQQAMRDFVKRARLSGDKLPSICFYTILNSFNNVNCCDISEDSTWLILGLADSTVRVCTICDKLKLKTIKALHDLETLDKESDDILNMMFDEESGVDHRTLIGHTGPVYGVSFSPDKYYCLSCSEDGTVRLWCLLTYSCLVSYKGHNGPVWDVKFGPYGHYLLLVAWIRPQEFGHRISINR